MNNLNKTSVKLSLIVPCYNEAANVRAFRQAVLDAFDDADYLYEIVFVDDGSADGTLKELHSLYEEGICPTTVVSFSRNFGKEAAILAGLNRASGELMTIIDADLQQDPAIARRMVDYLDEHPEYDCVAAYQEERIEGAFISGCKGIFYKLMNKLSDTTFYPGASDFRTFRRNVAEAVRTLPEYSRFSKGIFAWVGFNTYYMPYIPNERFAGTTKWSFRKLVKYACDGIVAYTTAPLRLAAYIGAMSSLLAVLYLLVSVFKTIFIGESVKGYTTIVVLVLFVGGVQLMMLGIIGEYLSKIYLQVKNRPVYIERECLVSKVPGQEEKADGED